ncbi:MAG TPA: hypothetical protein VEC35_01765 [Noviherbaspirillum sp.]|nr:hypothetical protein [Noviherbaspirillum sp.]
MLKQALAVLLLVPAATWAECGFASGDGEMIIVVGKQADNKCFASGKFREAFRANLVASVKHMEDSSPQPVRVARRPPGQKSSSMELPVQQAVLYYGQNPKR